MDIDTFIAARRSRWGKLEGACRHGRRGLTRLSGAEVQEVVSLYLAASADLSEVQTRYQDPRLTGYLAGLVANASSAIYSAHPRTTKGFLGVFGARYRTAVRQTVPFVLISAAVLAGVTAAVYLWVVWSPAAQGGLVPPQARAAIQKAGAQRPDFGINPTALSSLIFLNNVRVAVLAFAAGIGAGVGTVWMLAYNGFIIGALGGGYAALGKAGFFWGLIIPHGLLELTAIAIAAGAGLRIGWSVVSPGDRFRSTALAQESSEAILVVVGVIPAFLIAALIEGLVTGTGVPVAAQIALGVAAEVAYLGFLFGWRRTKPETGLPGGQTTAARTP